MRIGIDLLGSDTPPADLFPAALRIAEEAAARMTLTLFATPAVAEEIGKDPLPKNIIIRHVDEFINMADDPLIAIRKKKNSSIVAGMRQLKKRQLDAFISAGNTGALIAGAALILPMLPGIKRPALLAALPTLRHPLTVIDVGGNISSKAPHLLQFAQLGAAFHRCSRNAASARIGLLNIGTESKKGTAELRLAYSLLQEHYGEGRSPLATFVGNVEARHVFDGNVDVLVTDGFTGNILLKTSEGVSSFVFDYIRKHAHGALSAAANEVQGIFDHAEHPGAIVCGVDGLVIKCHGNASATSLYSAIKGAAALLDRRLIEQMKGALPADEVRPS